MRKTCFARLWLSVALTLGLGGIAAAQPNLNLPPGQVMPTVRFSTTMSLPGYFTVQFPGIPNGYDIHNAQTYLAWCAQANGTLLLGAVAPPIYGENTAKFTLYNTYPNSALPAPAQSGNWPQVNYLLNHKNGATVADIQSAIWYLLDGFYDGPYVSNTPPNAATQALLTDAANNGTNFVPQPGQVVAVFLYGNSLGLNTSGGNPQDLVIEVPIPTGATIGDFVWNDSNNDGIQNCGELGINNVTVQLWTGSVGTGTLYATTTTGAAPAGYTNTYKLGCQENGYYQFSGLPPGDYCVAILAGQPALSGLNLVTALQGADTNLDSNGLPGPGGYSANACLTVPANSINESIDFGYSGPQLQVVKTPKSGTFTSGSQVSFTIVVSNPAPAGSQNATNVMLNDALPVNGGLTWVSATTTQGTCSITNNNLSCALGTLTPGQSATVVVSSPTNPPSSACQDQPNAAAIATADGGLTAQDSGFQTCTPVQPPAELAATKSSGSFPFEGQASFTITVSNPAAAGSQPATDVALNDVLPTVGGMTWATATASQGVCTINGGSLLSCSLGTIAPQAAVTIVVSSPATTPANACQLQPNPAAIATASGGLTATASGSLTCTPPPPQLAVTKSSGSFLFTGQASFTITVSNPAAAGSQPALNVALNDVLPTVGGMTWATATASQGGCTISGGNLLSCSLGTIAAQAAVTIVVSSPAMTPADACQLQPNPAAIATASGGLTATASGSLTCTPPQQPSISLTKSVNTSRTAPNAPVTFTYTVTNTGTIPLTNVTITDDNATPNYTGDDFTLGPINLGPGGQQQFTVTLIPVIQECVNVNSNPNTAAGILITQVLPSADLKITYRQSTGLVDNTYGANVSSGYPNGHKFSDLTGSDGANFQVYDANGNLVLDFVFDYLTQSSAYPSGYGTLGATGGDGKLNAGNAAWILGVLAPGTLSDGITLVRSTTTITTNLNQSSAYYGYTTNSPATTDPNYPGWEVVDGYTIYVSKAAFPNGFGQVTVPYVHDSPSKVPGIIKFTPTPCPNYDVTNTATVTATAGAIQLTATATATVTEITPQPLAVACAAKTATTSVPYSSGVTASGGAGSYTYALTAGSLPPGLTLDTGTGAITGTPTKAGTFSYTVRVTDSGGATATTSNCSIVVKALADLKAAFPAATGKVGTTFNGSVTATGGSGSYTFAITSGNLPPGLTLDPATGAISGIPSAAGKYTATVTVMDSLGDTATATGTITINPLPVLKATFPGGPAANGKVGNAYNQRITASGGAVPYTFVLTSGSLPPGLTLDPSTGGITGTPTAAGRYTPTVTVTDSYSNTATASGTITINP